jgi:L-aminopeptidase/D-esterase-like protein
LSPVFSAVIESVDEAILNALVCNKTMVGRDGHTVEALPHGPIETWCKSMNALSKPPQRGTD